MVIKVGDKWCKATTTWKFWWNFLAKSLIFSRYPSFSPFERPDAYKCYTFSESYGSRETREIKISTSKFDLEARGILSSLWTQTGPWFDTASYVNYENKIFETNLKLYLDEKWRGKKDWEKDANSREEKSLKVSHFIFKIWCIGVFPSYSILLKTDFLFYFSFRESNIR